MGSLLERLAQLKIDQRVFLTPSKRKLDVNIVQSNCHIELTPRYVYICSGRQADSALRRMGRC